MASTGRPVFLLITALTLCIGTVGGLAAAWLGLPMPYLLGSLASTATLVAVAGRHFPKRYEFPQKFRMLFVSVIGVMIGAQVTPELFRQVPQMLFSFAAVIVFVVLAHLISYRILRSLGGYDPTTAFYASAPGGLIESILLGEAAGGDVRLMTLQQFLRIITVVVLVPLAISIWLGEPVGSAAGLSFSNDPAGNEQVVVVILLGLVGLVAGHFLRLPAAQLMGPLVVTALAHSLGLVTVNAPAWLIACAQIGLGVNLGLRFVGLERRMVVRGLGLSVVSVGAMLALGTALALVVNAVTGIAVDVLIISYAPGGLTEMSLIAVSLSANPALVTLHHLFRITLTVVELSMARRLGFAQK